MAIVSYTLEELRKMPSLTDWERLRNIRDENIIYDDDNPAWTNEDFARATRNGKPLFGTPPPRRSVSLRRVRSKSPDLQKIDKP